MAGTQGAQGSSLPRHVKLDLQLMNDLEACIIKLELALYELRATVQATPCHWLP